jgi:hypothetical protein
MRASLVVLFLFFGYQKWFDYEAQVLDSLYQQRPTKLFHGCTRCSRHPEERAGLLGGHASVVRSRFRPALYSSSWEVSSCANKRLGIVSAPRSDPVRLSVREYRHHHPVPARQLGGHRLRGFSRFETGNVPFLMKGRASSSP